MLSVSFAMEAGLALRLSTPESTTTCVASSPSVLRTDPLTDLVRALRHFSAGMPDVSCRWPDHEGGHFLDLSRIDDDHCAVAVHAFAVPAWRSSTGWLPSEVRCASARTYPPTR